MLQPPRKLSFANTAASYAARPPPSVGIGERGSPPKGRSTAAHSNSPSPVDNSEERAIFPMTRTPTPTMLSSSLSDFHERDAPARSPQDAWRQQAVRSSVEVYGERNHHTYDAANDAARERETNKENNRSDVAAAAKKSSFHNKPLFDSRVAKTSSSSSIGIGGGSGLSVKKSAPPLAGEMRPVGSAGLFKVFRPRDGNGMIHVTNSDSWMKLEKGGGRDLGNNHFSERGGGGDPPPRTLFVHSDVPKEVARPKVVDDVIQQQQHRHAKTAAIEQISRTESGLSCLDQNHYADEDTSRERRQDHVDPLSASFVHTEGERKGADVSVTADGGLVLNEYERMTAASGLKEHQEAERRRNMLFPSSSSYNYAGNRSPRLGASNPGLGDSPQYAFGKGNGMSLAGGGGGGHSNTVGLLSDKFAPSNDYYVGRGGDNKNKYDAVEPPTKGITKRQEQEVALAHSNNTSIVNLGELRAMDELIIDEKRLRAEQQEKTIDTLRRELDHVRAKFNESRKTVEKYESMFGGESFEQFKTKQIHLREEVVKLRDDIIRLEERDGASRRRIVELETTLRRAGYSGGILASDGTGIETATVTPSSSSTLSSDAIMRGGMTKSGGPHASMTFIAQSQRRLEELQGRLSRALVMRGHLVDQIAEVEGLADTYAAADDLVSPVRGSVKDVSHQQSLLSEDVRDAQKVALLDAPTHHSWRMRGKKAELELKLRTQEDLVASLNAAIDAQRETLSSEQEKQKVKMISTGDAVTPSSPPSSSHRSPSKQNLAAISLALPKGENGRIPAVISDPKAHEQATRSLLADVRPGSEAEIQRLLAVVNAKNEQILQMRQLLEAVAKSGRLGLNTVPASAGDDKGKALEQERPPALRSLPPIDVHGQLLSAASESPAARNDGERASPSDILYPHQNSLPSAFTANGTSPSAPVDHVALATQLWHMESENTHLNKRCTDLILQVMEKNKRIKELEKIAVEAVAARGRPPQQGGMGSNDDEFAL